MTEHFNLALFDGALRAPLLTIKRGLGSLGYFSAARWVRNSERIPEIALNSELFAERSWLSLMQTVVHQQCHAWQHQFGRPSRPGYHNAEWAEQMEKLGLVPSVTGEPGGRKTGQHILEYPIIGGPFIRACAAFAENEMKLPLTGRFAKAAEWKGDTPPFEVGLPKKVLNRLCAPVGSMTDDVEISQRDGLRVAKRKVKYSCPLCGTIVWGRSGLGLKCQKCKRLFREGRGEISDYSRLYV